MPKKERTFAAKLAHEARKSHKKTCTVCGKETVPIVHYAALYNEEGAWRPQLRRVTVCDCNREEIYG
jgi:hypothetical protein